jgi:hypothetical protein
MNKSNNVIDLKSRLQAKAATENKTKKGSTSAPVVDMTERRNEILSSERRTVRRTILSEFVGACIVVPQKGLQKVALYDISENGLAFDMDPELGKFLNGEEIAMRVYLNHQTYFPFILKISNVRFITDEGVHRHGANFIKGSEC